MAKAGRFQDSHIFTSVKPHRRFFLKKISSNRRTKRVMLLHRLSKCVASRVNVTKMVRIRGSTASGSKIEKTDGRRAPPIGRNDTCLEDSLLIPKQKSLQLANFVLRFFFFFGINFIYSLFCKFVQILSFY